MVEKATEYDNQLDIWNFTGQCQLELCYYQHYPSWSPQPKETGSFLTTVSQKHEKVTRAQLASTSMTCKASFQTRQYLFLLKFLLLISEEQQNEELVTHHMNPCAQQLSDHRHA